MKRALLVAVVTMVGVPSAGAAPIIYANNAGSPNIKLIDGATRTVVQEFTINGGSGNGRGVVVVGNVLYFTLANSGNVFTHNLVTNVEGVAFNVAGATGLSTIAFDGANFWIGDYSGTNQAYHYTPTGTLLDTINLVNCVAFCDGLEFFLQNGQGRLLSNRGDTTFSPYDLYDTDGTLLQAAFLPFTNAARGIAFDGTDFWVASGASSLLRYDGTTGALISSGVVTGALLNLNFEDLSVDYRLVLPPPPGVPEPSSILLLGSGLVGMVVRRFRQRP